MLSACQKLSVPRCGGWEAGLSNQNDAAPKMGKLLLVTALSAIAVSVLLYLALSVTNLLPVNMHGGHPHDGEQPPRSDQLVLMSVDSASGGTAKSEPLDELLPYLYAQDSQYCANLLPEDECSSSES